MAEELYQAGFISYPRTETDYFSENTDLQVSWLIFIMPFNSTDVYFIFVFEVVFVNKKMHCLNWVPSPLTMEMNGILP